MNTGYLITVDTHGRWTITRSPAAGTCSGHHPLVLSAVDQEAGIAGAMIGAFHYREDLGSRFRGSRPGQGATDIALALAAYRNEGLKGLERLEGEFALVIWDGPRRRLAALRDPFGSWPLYWRAQDSQIAVSTSLTALAELRPPGRLDQEYIAEFLMFPNPHSELPTEQTAFEGVSRIRPGSILEWHTSGRASRHYYWDWAARTEPTGGMTLAESGERFAELLGRAVSERMSEGPVAAHVSGGMDSSSVAALARDRLIAGGSGEPLIGLSLVYRRSSLSGEREFIDEFLRQGGPLVPCYIEGETVPDYDWFRSGIPLHDEPYSGLPSFRVHQALIEAAGHHGASTILTGVGSDELLAWQPAAIADLIQAGRWFAAVREARRWARGLNWGFWTAFHQFGLQQILPILLQEGVRHRFSGGYGKWPTLGWFTVPPWILPEFSRSYQLRQRGIDHARRLSSKPTSRSMQSHVLETSAGDWSRWYLANPLGLNVSHPFQDPRVVCFALQSIQQFRRDPSQRKPVLRAAMRGRLPDKILDRKEKAGFDDVYAFGLTSNLNCLENMVRSSDIQELGVIDKSQLLDCLHEAALGIGGIRARERLDKTLALIAWYDQLMGRKGSIEVTGTSVLQPATEIGARTAADDVAVTSP